MFTVPFPGQSRRLKESRLCTRRLRFPLTLRSLSSTAARSPTTSPPSPHGSSRTPTTVSPLELHHKFQRELHPVDEPPLTPRAVISILIVNSDNLPPTAYTSAFDSAGLTNYTYSPSSSSTTLSAWPTLGTLIDAGTRVVVFMDYDASFSSVPWIIDEFSNMWEDAYGECLGFSAPLGPLPVLSRPRRVAAWRMKR
jgi:hypothetical protein